MKAGKRPVTARAALERHQALTFEDHIETTAAKSNELPTKAPSTKVEYEAVFESGAVSQTRIDPTYTPLELQFTNDFSLATGVYLVTGPKGVGKSVVTTAIVGWANDVGIPAQYFPCFEPRAPTYPAVAAVVSEKSEPGQKKKKTRITGLSDTHTPFSDPTEFWIDASAMVKKVPGGGLVVFDSVTDPLKALDPEKWRGQATFPGGMQPSDRDFLNLGAQLARMKNLCIFLVINSQLINYANDLAGATEGLIDIVSINIFRREDRTAQSGRRQREVEIPEQFVAASLAVHGFGEYKPSLSMTRGRKVIGL